MTAEEADKKYTVASTRVQEAKAAFIEALTKQVVPILSTFSSLLAIKAKEKK